VRRQPEERYADMAEEIDGNESRDIDGSGACR
jgi:hypothetical protein